MGLPRARLCPAPWAWPTVHPLTPSSTPLTFLQVSSWLRKPPPTSPQCCGPARPPRPPPPLPVCSLTDFLTIAGSHKVDSRGWQTHRSTLTKQKVKPLRGPARRRLWLVTQGAERWRRGGNSLQALSPETHGRETQIASTLGSGCRRLGSPGKLWTQFCHVKSKTLSPYVN